MQHLPGGFSEATKGFGGRAHAVTKRSHVADLAVLGYTSHGLTEDLEKGQNKLRSQKNLTVIATRFHCFDRPAVFLMTHLGVLHHTLDAVKVRQVIDRFTGVVQHSSHSLGDK